MSPAELRSSRVVPLRDDLSELSGYHSPQVEVDVRLNTNESPFSPPDSWLADLRSELERIDFNRYPDREACDLRAALADFHGVTPEEVFCANGSNEVLQSLLLAYGGAGRVAAVFEPTYALHRHISGLTATEVVSAWRSEDHRIDLDAADALLHATRPVVTFLCSPNNPTGLSEPPEVVAHFLERVPGLLVVDEAYGQFAPHSALDARGLRGAGRMVVVRTFSKTWSMAAFRLGYLVAEPEVVEACHRVSLPYHLDSVKQAAGRLALGHVEEMERRVSLVNEERGRLLAAFADLPVETWPSEANFVLFRPLSKSAQQVWADLLEESVLVRDCSQWPGLTECLRVTVGTPTENDRFLVALRSSLGSSR